MSDYWFDDAARREILLAELTEWEGTPFLPFHMRKGVGVDCVRFPYAVVDGLGWRNPIVWPKYRYRSIGRTELDKLTETLSQVAALEIVFDNPEFDPEAFTAQAAAGLMVGDLLVFSTGNGFHHCGLMADRDTFYDCLRAVARNSIIDSTYTRRMYRVYRMEGQQPWA